MKKLLPELADALVVVAITDDPVNFSCDIPTANIANYGSVGRRKSLCVLFQPIVIFDCCLDPTFAGYIDSHAAENLPRAPQQAEVFLWCTLPKMNVKRLGADNARACGQVDDLCRHWYFLQALTR